MNDVLNSDTTEGTGKTLVRGTFSPALTARRDRPVRSSFGGLQIEWLSQGGLERVADPDPRSYVWR